VSPRGHALAALATALALAGCGSGDKGARTTPGPALRTGQERAIKGWIDALNRMDYERAASFFAPGAVVHQAEEFRLPDHAAAVEFNRGLPCDADLTGLHRERSSVLAAFRLREGPGAPGGSCQGEARVRFRFRGGRFSEWRQLPMGASPPGRTV
jgi:SnoaL-like protein